MIIFAFDPGARWTGHGSIVGTVGGKNKSLTRYHISRRQTLIQNVFIWMRINESTFSFFRTLQKWTFVLFLSPNIRTNLQLKPSVETFLSYFEPIALGQFYHIFFSGHQQWPQQQKDQTTTRSHQQNESSSTTTTTIVGRNGCSHIACHQFWSQFGRGFESLFN